MILHRSKKTTYLLLVKNKEIPSVHNSALIQRDHIPTVDERRDSITTWFYIDQTRSHTFCGWKIGRSYDQMILHRSNEITYILWVKHREIPWAHDFALIQGDHVHPVGDSVKHGVITRFCIDPTRSHTSCEWKIGRSHEQMILHRSN